MKHVTATSLVSRAAWCRLLVCALFLVMALAIDASRTQAYSRTCWVLESTCIGSSCHPWGMYPPPDWPWARLWLRCKECDDGDCWYSLEQYNEDCCWFA